MSVQRCNHGQCFVTNPPPSPLAPAPRFPIPLVLLETSPQALKHWALSNHHTFLPILCSDLGAGPMRKAFGAQGLGNIECFVCCGFCQYHQRLLSDNTNLALLPLSAPDITRHEACLTSVGANRTGHISLSTPRERNATSHPPTMPWRGRVITVPWPVPPPSISS